MALHADQMSSLPSFIAYKTIPTTTRNVPATISKVREVYVINDRFGCSPQSRQSYWVTKIISNLLWQHNWVQCPSLSFIQHTCSQQHDFRRGQDETRTILRTGVYETARRRWGEFLHPKQLKSFVCRLDLSPLSNKNSGVNVAMHLDLEEKCAPHHVQRYLLGFVAWDLKINAWLYWFQEPELPDLPTISLPISASALPTFSFTSPLPASAIGSTSSVPVTPVKEAVTVKVCVHILFHSLTSVPILLKTYCGCLCISIPRFCCPLTVLSGNTTILTYCTLQQRFDISARLQVEGKQAGPGTAHNKNFHWYRYNSEL